MRSLTIFLDEIQEFSFSFLENLYYPRKTKKQDSILPNFTKIISLFKGLSDFFAHFIFCYYHHLLDVNLLSPPPALSARNWFILCHTRAANELVKGFNEPWCLLVIPKKIKSLSQIVKIIHIVLELFNAQ